MGVHFEYSVIQGVLADVDRCSDKDYGLDGEVGVRFPAGGQNSTHSLSCNL
jgi:hypothetical protein